LQAASRVLSYSRPGAAQEIERVPPRLNRSATPNSTPAINSTTDEYRVSVTTRRLANSLDTQNAATRLHQQDSVLQHAAALLSRIDELKSLASAPESAEAERAAYEDEFTQLRTDLRSLGGSDISGAPLIETDASQADDTPGTAEATGSTAAAGSSDSASSDFVTEFSDDFSTTDNWTSLYGELSVSDHTFFPTAGSYGAAQTKQSFRGAMEIKFDLFLPGAVDSLDVSVGDTHLSNLTDSTNINKWQWHSVRIAYDGAGNAATYLDGSAEAADTQSGLAPASGQLSLTNLGLGSAWIRNFSVSATGEEIATATAADLAAVAQADDLSSLDADNITAATQHIATLQAANDQTLAALSNSTTSVNTPDENDPPLEFGHDAEELTELTTHEILLNSGIAFLAQANLDEENVLTLLG